MKKSNKKTLVLSIVAFVLILMSLVSFTYSWIDDIKLVEFQNDNLAQNGAPLKTGTDINATVNITKEENTIDLGNMLKTGDISFQYDNGTAEEYEEENANTPTSPTQHIKYDTENGDTVKDPKWDDAGNQKGINSKKGYFYESGDMHLSPCYSNGETFYFPRQGQSGYREGNKDDENVNYISFTAKVSSPDATTDFWFDSMPTIQGKNASGSTVDVNSYARYAIIVDGECHVYSSSGTAKTCNSGLTGTTDVTGVRKTANYTYGDSTNKTAERGDNSNTLFSIKKGGTVNMTIKIWLEGGVGNDVTASNINLKLISSWSKSRKIWIDDKTTNGGGGNWLDDGSARLFVTFPVFLNDISTTVSEWPNLAVENNAPFFPIQTSNNKYYVEVPLVYNNEKMILYRCNSSGWNSAGSDAAKRSDYNVYCWNWWQTNTPNTYKDETYTLYGGSLDNTAYGYFNSIDQGFTVTNKGYGTWGAVEEIKVFSYYNNNDLATKGDGKAMYVVDHSDEDTSGETYIYEMYRSGTTSSDPWKTYVPAGSSKIQFRYFGGESGLSWGYNSWNGINPQRRPLASTGLYPNNATEYQLGAIFNDVNGWGYWRDTQNHEYDKLYLVKKGSMVGLANHVYDYLYDNNTTPNKNHAWPGVEMSRMKDASNNDVTWNDGSSWVMQSDTTRPGSTIYNNVMFNNGGDGNGDKTGTLATFPGCFYNPDDNKWYGAINDVGREVVDTGGGESSDTGTDVGGGSMSGYETPTKFVFKLSGTEYDVFSNSAGDSFKVRLPLSAGDNWITVQKKEGDYPEYGNGQAGQYYETREGVDLYLTTSNSNNFSIRAGSAGNFIVTFQYDNGNQNTIKITSILKEG